MNHTPTPWSDDFEKGDGSIRQRATGVLLAYATLPNDGTPYGEMRERRLGNAAFIVKAVNNHKKLKAERDKLHEAIGKAIEQVESRHTVAAFHTLKEALGLREAGKKKS